MAKGARRRNGDERSPVVSALGPPSDLTCRVLRAEGAELVLLTYTPVASSHLTEAERDVAVAVTRGLSNAEIAVARHASVRTIANQVASILDKLGVSSRVELAAKLDVRDLL